MRLSAPIAGGRPVDGGGAHALVSSRVAIASDPAAYLFMGRSEMPGTGRTNATAPYTARVDAMRRGIFASQHTIGLGGALDLDPATPEKMMIGSINCRVVSTVLPYQRA